MRKLFSAAVLLIVSVPAFAAITPGSVGQVPEPEALALLAIGAVSMVVARRKK
jgi:hypothetical protein